MDLKYDISDFLPLRTIENTLTSLVNREIKRRKEHHYSQKRLSELSGVSYASIRRFEKSGEISLSSLFKIAMALDCLSDFDSLFSVPYIKDLEDYQVK
ncbi:MAG: helix-turn-helix domain-containing protein [Coprobacillus sp.]|nr:helix-turn-helix domain-containing protein [Coprobacillus sp.]